MPPVDEGPGCETEATRHYQSAEQTPVSSPKYEEQHVDPPLTLKIHVQSINISVTYCRKLSTKLYYSYN